MRDDNHPGRTLGASAVTLLSLAFVTGALAWVLVALPVFTFSNMPRHVSHFSQVYVHAIGGTLMLTGGGVNIYLGLTRKYIRWHRLLGYTYIGGGVVGATTAIYLALSTGHSAPDRPFAFDPLSASDTGWALAALGAAWILATGMAYRAARNRRITSHQEWMTRSYVLVWSFVLCRLIGKIPSFPELGGGAAVIWLSWVVPLLLCEAGLQWSSGRRLVAR